MLNSVDKQFHDLYQNLIAKGHLKGDRTGHGTLMLPAQMMRFDCTENKLPILSTRFIPTKAFRREMHWFISGNSSIKYLRDHKVGVWDSWFIPGTDKYDEPVTYQYDLQERIDIAVKQGMLNDILEYVAHLRALFRSMGSYSFTYVGEDGRRIQIANLAKNYLNELGVFLTGCKIPTQHTPRFRPVPFEEQLKLAVAAGRSAEIIEFTRTLESYEGRCYKQIELLESGGKVVMVGLGRTQYLEVEDFVAAWGYGTKVPNGGEKIALQRRLNRVSKNNTEAWDVINRVIDEDWESLRTNWVGEAILDPEGTQTYTVFREGKFQNIELIPLVAACVNKRLDDLAIPAYELLDADIGAGGYGPNWRKYQDTQVIDGGDRTLVGAYGKQGYECLGILQEGAGWDNGKIVMHREIDQLQNAIDMLKSNPDDRRMIVTAWNPGRTWQAALPPCHLYFQFVSWVKTTAELEAVIRKSALHGNYLRESIHADVPGPDNDAWFHEYAYDFCVKNGLITRNLTLFVLLRS